MEYVDAGGFSVRFSARLPEKLPEKPNGKPGAIGPTACFHRFVKFIDSGVVCATCGERVEGFAFFCRDCGTEWRTPGQAMRCLHLKPESGVEA